MKSPFFSVIIPVYNVEDYLAKCVENVLVQSFTNYEIILVDDGSPDNSGKICDAYAAQDKRIKALHTVNGGSSDARNKGLAVATGQYVIFLDSDDYWDDASALSQLYLSLSQKPSDILLFNCKDFDCSQNRMFRNRGDYDLKIFNQSKNEILTDLLQHNLFPGAAWILTVKKSLLQEHHIHFVKGHKAEDIDWLLGVFTTAKSINAINADFYVYLKNRSGSITSAVDDKGVAGILYAISQWKETFIISKNPMISVLQYQYLVLIMNLSKGGMLERYKKDIIKHKDLLDSHFSSTNSNKIASRLIQIFGFKNGALLLSWLYKRKQRRK